MRRKKDKTLIKAITVVVLAGVIVATVVFVTKTNNMRAGDPQTPSAIIEDGSVKYSQEEVEELVAAARLAGKGELLENMKYKLSEGNTPLSVFKELYPESIVVASQGAYHFVDIVDTIPHNNFSQENMLVNEETGEVSYTENGEIVSKKGIDVSSHQGEIDWEKVKNDGIEFAFIRAVYRGYESGKLVEDEFFLKNLEGAKAAGVPCGVYVFSQAINATEAMEEADMVLDLLNGESLELPIVFDVERVSSSKGRMNALSVEDRTQIVIAFLEEIRSRGYDVMIYHNTEMGALFLDLSKLTDYDKWFAGYTQEMYWPYDYKIWQYSEKGRVDGIKSDVDLNIMLY